MRGRVASAGANSLQCLPIEETTVQKYEQFARRPKVFGKTFDRKAKKLHKVPSRRLVLVEDQNYRGVVGVGDVISLLRLLAELADGLLRRGATHNSYSG